MLVRPHIDVINSSNLWQELEKKLQQLRLSRVARGKGIGRAMPADPAAASWLRSIRLLYRGVDIRDRQEVSDPQPKM